VFLGEVCSPIATESDTPGSDALELIVLRTLVDSEPLPFPSADLGDVCRPIASPPVDPVPFTIELLGDVCSPMEDSEPNPLAEALL
jgi:hypothetical protein